MKQWYDTLENVTFYQARKGTGETSLRLLLVLQGQVNVVTPGQSQTLPMGTVCRLSSEAAISACEATDRYAEISVSSLCLGEFNALCQAAEGRALTDAQREFAHALLTLCVSTPEGACQKHLLIALLISVLTSESAKDNGIPPKLRSVLEWLEENYESDCNLETVAARFHYNAAYLSRLFRRNMHVSMAAYVRQLRLYRATELLEQTNDAVQQIAVQVGYHDPQHFFRHFKESYGVTPQRYRMTHCKGV